MILGIGADIVFVPRIYRIVMRRSPLRFARAIMDDRELHDFEARFAALSRTSDSSADYDGSSGFGGFYTADHDASRVSKTSFNLSMPLCKALLHRRPSTTTTTAAVSLLESNSSATASKTPEALHLNWHREEDSNIRRLVLFLAGRFAAKEAAFKALQPHYKLAWRDVCIKASESGNV
jgi:phosphopantetheinyl transferase (holo-ACP synthase)